MSTVANTSHDKRTYNPPVWRLLLFYFALPVTAALLGWVSRYLWDILNGRPENWLGISSSILTLAFAWAFWSFLLIGFNRDWFAIEIDDVSISGQASFGGRRVLLLNELDVEKSKRRTSLDRLSKVWTIWDKKRNRISINGWLFTDDQIAEILGILGLDNPL